MKSSALRQILLYALSLGIAACGAGDRSAPSLPTSAQGVPAPGVAAPGSSPEVWMPVTSEGAEPAGFKAVFRVDPKPDTEGIIHGDSPLTVEFDVCGSRTDADKTLSYLYDWDFDHVADVVGTGDACHQEHKYDTRRLTDAKGNVLFETNVCVVSGDPRLHGPGTYFSCRTFRISLPVSSQRSTFPHHTGYGQQWTDGVPTGTYDLAQATRACQEYVLGTAPGVDFCRTTGCGCPSPPSGPNQCTFNEAPPPLPRRVWFYTGPFVGQTTNDVCAFGLVWD